MGLKSSVLKFIKKSFEISHLSRVIWPFISVIKYSDDRSDRMMTHQKSDLLSELKGHKLDRENLPITRKINRSVAR